MSAPLRSARCTPRRRRLPRVGGRRDRELRLAHGPLRRRRRSATCPTARCRTRPARRPTDGRGAVHAGSLRPSSSRPRSSCSSSIARARWPSRSTAGSPTRSGNLPPGVLSRWDTLRDALFQTITPFDNAIAMGAKFYPRGAAGPDEPAPADEACRTDVGVGIAPARGNAREHHQRLRHDEPARRHADRRRPSASPRSTSPARAASRARSIVATDGAPNCNGDLDQTRCICTLRRPATARTRPGGEYNCLDDTRTIDVVRDVFENQKIPVYVIGIGSTERPEFLKVLDDMAVAGGRPRATTPRHYNVQTSAELKTALAVDPRQRCKVHVSHAVRPDRSERDQRRDRRRVDPARPDAHERLGLGRSGLRRRSRSSAPPATRRSAGRRRAADHRRRELREPLSVASAACAASPKRCSRPKARARAPRRSTALARALADVVATRARAPAVRGALPHRHACCRPRTSARSAPAARSCSRPRAR